MQTLSQIFADYSDEVQHVLIGGELSDKLFEVLFDHFCESGEIPYGAATASDEDPYEWIEAKVKEVAETVEVYDRPALPFWEPMDAFAFQTA